MAEHEDRSPDEPDERSVTIRRGGAGAVHARDTAIGLLVTRELHGDGNRVRSGPA